MPSIDGTDSMPAGDSAGRPEASAATAEAVAVDAPARKRQRGIRTLQREQRKQQQAAAALENAGEAPGLGALNRQLTLLTEQLGAAHRILGRVAAERDALRQRLADLQGIPVEDIVVTPAAAAEGPETEGHRIS